MAWTAIPDFVADQVIGESDLNTYLRDNENYLHSGRPKFSILRDNGANYTTTSTSFVDVDGTNLKGTLTISGSAVLIGVSGVCNPAGARPDFDILVDSTRWGAAGLDGLNRGTQGNGGDPGGFGFTALITGLSVGAHTFKIQWKVNAAGTTYLYAGAGSAGSDYIPHFWGLEVA